MQIWVNTENKLRKEIEYLRKESNSIFYHAKNMEQNIFLARRVPNRSRENLGFHSDDKVVFCLLEFALPDIELVSVPEVLFPSSSIFIFMSENTNEEREKKC